MNIVTMTDRAAECFEAEADLACGPETGQDLHGDDWVRSELDHFLDHLDDFDRDQRHFERYGTTVTVQIRSSKADWTRRSSSNWAICEASSQIDRKSVV